MLKLIIPDENHGTHGYKCGEIFYQTSTNYNVSCCLCGKTKSFDEFPQHFQAEHLNQITNLDLVQQSTETHLEKSGYEIKDDSDDEKPLSMLFPMDEHPIDLKEVQSDRRKSRQIIVESLKIKSTKACDITSEFSLLDKPAIFNEIEHSSENLHTEAEDTTSIFDDNENSKSSDESTIDIDFKRDSCFPCSECSNSYRSKRGLNNHIQSKHKNKVNRKSKCQKLKCKECGLIVPNEKFLKSHMYKHTGIFCDICGKPFSQVGNMNLHKVRHTGIKAHKCADCERTFYTDLELKKHMVCHTKRMPVICEVCGRGCRDQSVLNAHMRRHTGERPAKCEICGKCFFSIYDLNVHSVTHSTLRPFKCDECGSTFQTKKALRVHKKLHSKDRKHVCKICGKAFSQSGGLHAHMKTHDTAEGVPVLCSVEQ